MSQAAAKSPPILNVPNQVTALRLLLSIVLFAFMALGYYLTSFVLFLVAASTDWVDGYYARKYGQVTQLGRILDPFADKLVVCGAFIFLAAIPWSGIAPWVAVLIFGREILVTALRSFLEEQGADFSANWPGKIKMGVQCAAIGFSLFRLTYLNPDAIELAAAGQPFSPWQSEPPAWMTQGLVVCVWGAVLTTVYSGVGYIAAALRLLRR